MGRLGVAMGGDALTFGGLAGVGDLVATCTSDRSRNRRVGIGARLAAAPSTRASLAVGEVAEGVVSAEPLVALARDRRRRAADLRAGGRDGRRRRHAGRGARGARGEARARGVGRRALAGPPPLGRDAGVDALCGEPKRRDAVGTQLELGVEGTDARGPRGRPRGPGVPGPTRSPASSRGLNTRSSTSPSTTWRLDTSAPSTVSPAPAARATRRPRTASPRAARARRRRARQGSSASSADGVARVDPLRRRAGGPRRASGGRRASAAASCRGATASPSSAAA